MGNIHFIWCGPNKGSMSVETANIAARVLRPHQVQYWCFDQYRKGFADELESQIQLRRIEDLFRLPFGKFRNNNGDRALRELQDVLDALMALEAFSAAKDLVSLLALLEFGGYYLDTTTSIVGSAKMAAFSSKVVGYSAKENHAFDKTYDGPRFPWLRNRNGNGMQRRTIGGLQTGLSLVGGGLTYRNDMPGLLIDVPVIDVWAAYVPAGHSIAELMVLSYLSRANRLGINSSKEPINFDGWDGSKEMAKRTKDSIRNDIIGELVIGAVFDGLLEATGGDGDKISAFTWDAFGGWETWQFPPDGLVCVPELGIVKEYKNSWR